MSRPARFPPALGSRRGEADIGLAPSRSGRPDGRRNHFKSGGERPTPLSNRSKVTVRRAGLWLETPPSRLDLSPWSRSAPVPDGIEHNGQELRAPPDTS